MRFSANLGFLFQEFPLPDAIRAAHAAGFDAVECHWPHDTPVAEITAAMRETGLPMLSLNTRRGDVAAGDNGLAALADRTSEARAAIDEAIACADAIDCRAIHVMAGRAEGPAAHRAFIENLRYATSRTDRTILIEALNPYDAPGYFLKTTGQAKEIVEEVAALNLRVMFDCYHVARTEGDILSRFQAIQPLVGHVQFAAVPSRGAPDHGEVDYAALLSELRDAGWSQPFGAEYRPDRPTADTLAWLDAMRFAKLPFRPNP